MPAGSLSDIQLLLRSSVELAKVSHEKMTVRQTLFLFAVSYHSLKGESVTLSRLRGLYSPLGRSIEKSISQFLEPTARTPDALGWIVQTLDPSDRRLRYLSLSEAGAKALREIIAAMRRS